MIQVYFFFLFTEIQNISNTGSDAISLIFKFHIIVL